MKNNEIKFAKTLVIVTLFTAIVLVFQLSRMGVLDTTRGGQAAREEPVSAGEPLEALTLETDTPLIGILADGKDPNKDYLIEGTAQYLAHLDYQYEYIEDSKVLELQQYDMLLVFLTNFDDGAYMSAVMDYVRSGKFAYFPYLPFDRNSYSSNLRKIGVLESQYENFSIDRIQDTGGVLGEADAVYEIPRTVDMSIKVRLAKDSELLLASEGLPLMWSLPYGERRPLTGSS